MSGPLPKLLFISSSSNGFDTISIPAKSYFDIQIAKSLESGIFLTQEWAPQIIAFDLNDDLPAYYRFLRDHYPIIRPGILAFGESHVTHEEIAFANGADHFMPFESSPQSFAFRVLALVRKLNRLKNYVEGDSSLNQEQRYALQFESLEIYPNDFLVKRQGQMITTTPTQFKLLKMFVSHQEQLLTRNQIQKAVWEGSKISPRSIDAQISKLKKIVPELDKFLMNIYGKGYILTKTKSQAA